MRSIVTVTTAATIPMRLTTLDRVKRELDITTSAKDQTLLDKLDEASSDIEAALAYRVPRESVTETFWHESQDASEDFLVLKRFPVASIGNVTVDGEVLDASEYRLDAELGLLFRLNPTGYPWVWHFCKSIEIAYVAGYILPGQSGRNLPQGIEGAAIELMSDYWLAKGRDPSVKSEEEPGVFRVDYWVGAVGETGELPPRVQMKLMPFRRANV